MKHFLPVLACLAILAGCGENASKQEEGKALQEVAGRTNFGPDYALVTVPQPCVMIATWDKDHNPDVMMAAWAGQYDARQIVISLSPHKTTENLALTGAFTVSFADERTVAESDYFGLVSGHQVPDNHHYSQPQCGCAHHQRVSAHAGVQGGAFHGRIPGR